MDTAKLEKLFALLASDNDGEVLATVAAIRRVLKASGLGLSDLGKLVNKPPRIIEVHSASQQSEDMRVVRDMLAELFPSEGFLSAREREFIDSLIDRARRNRWQISEKQADWLFSIHGRWKRTRATEKASA